VSTPLIACCGRILCRFVEGLLKKASISKMQSQNSMDLLRQASAKVCSNLLLEHSPAVTKASEGQPWNVILQEKVCVDDYPSPPTSPSMMAAAKSQLGVSPKQNKVVSLPDPPLGTVHEPIFKGVALKWREHSTETIIVLDQAGKAMESRIQAHFPQILLTPAMHTFLLQSSLLNPQHNRPNNANYLNAEEEWNLDPPLLVIPFLMFKPSFYHTLLHQLSNLAFLKAELKTSSLMLPLFLDKKAKNFRIKNILPRVYVCWFCPEMPRRKHVGQTIYKERVKEEINN
jgi:hypothetical protein